MPVNFKNPDLAMTDQTADKDYFLDKDGNIAQDEAAAATLLVRKGQTLTRSAAEKIGQQGSSPEAAEAEESEGSGEKATAPTANKSAAPTKGKGAKK